MKKYRLILSGDTFLWVRGNEGLVYQSNNYRSFVFFVTDILHVICSYLLVLEHLYTVELTEEDLNKHEVRNFVDKLIEIDAGRLISNTGAKKGAVSLMPVLLIQEQIDYYIRKHERGVGGSIIKHIHELTFYVNGSAYGNDLYYRQTVFPTRAELMLESEKIIRFIRNSKNPFLFNINLVGNIFSYPDFDILLRQIESFEIPVTICLTASDVLANRDDMLKKTDWSGKTGFRIIMDQKNSITQAIAICKDASLPVSVDFIIFSEQDYLDVEQIASTINGNFVPVYNGNNIDFFETNIFINQEEILASALSKREIFKRQATNIFHFGKLTVLEGNVYADLNQTPLGTIDDTVYSIVYREFTEGKSWFRIRDFEPCNNCIYQWLCPSPSNYEIAIGYPNLCHVRSNNRVC